MDPETREAAVELARSLVHPGFTDREEILLHVAESLEDELEPDAADALAREVVQLVWQEHLHAQAGWPETTDADRLYAAFDELTGLGVVCRMDFACCTRCGTAEIGDERTPLAPGEEPPARGYGAREWSSVFFHQQDSEALATEPAVLHLTYGCWVAGPPLPADVRRRRWRRSKKAWAEMDAALGRLIVETLHQHGLQTRWDGDPTERISVVDLHWRKRLGTDRPLVPAYGRG